jgi:hypothetical protein
MRRITVSIKLRILQLFVEQFALPYRMAIVLDIVYQECRQGKSTEALDVPTDRPIHHQELSQAGLFEDCIEDSSPTLRMTQHRKVIPIIKRPQDVLEKLQGKSLDGFLAALRSTVSRAINGHDVVLLQIGDPHKVLMQQVGILIS